jgi:hypothetical protein
MNPVPPSITDKTQSGVDVMIIIFLRFSTIFGENIGVFLKKPMLTSKFCIILFLSKKRQFFGLKFLAKIF